MRAANPYIFKIKPYVPGKPIDEVKRELGLKTVVKLASNENPYPPSPKVLTAMAKAALEVNRYPDGGCFLLRRILAKKLNIDEDQLILGNGSDEIIVLAVKAFVTKQDEVIIAKPSFLIYEIASTLSGARLRQVPLKNFRYDLQAMKAKINARTKIIFIGNPDNPAGTYITARQVEDFMRCVPKSALVFFDEAYFEYVQAKDYPDTLALMKKYSNVMTTRTFSKIYGLAGLRIGYGIASREIIDILNRLREPFNVNSMAQAAAVAVLGDEAYYRNIVKDVHEQKQYLYRSLKGMDISYEESSTNFILIHVRGDSSQAAGALLKKGVIVRDMAVWGLKGYIRVSIGSAPENKRFIKTLGEIL
ncbi:MAG: histidinol-phosphate transaminase [Candidatus Omnitrophica bacterium]|nr:histidinol-phosphate transaminase [Candidatus Omnitrophota bacterium]